MAAEKQSRKELLEEPDPVTLTLQRTAALFTAYWKPIISGVVAVLAIIAVVSGYFYYQRQAEEQAAVLFTRSMTQYEAVRADNGNAEEYQAVKENFKRILDNYGNTEVADMALVQYASACYRSGDLEEAVESYEKALTRMSRDHEFREMAVNGLAYAYVEMGDRDKAIAMFERIVDNPDAATRDHALFNLGQLYADAGEPGKSREAFEKILADHPDSIYYDMARTEVD